MQERTFTVLCPFSGLGGGALGFLESEARLFGARARFRCLGGIDFDPLACEDFRNLTGCPALCTDVAQLSVDELRAFAGAAAPDVVFMSPPCKGASGLLSAKKAKTAKYRAMNRLALVWTKLMLEAWADAPPRLVLLENVPRLKQRAGRMLRAVRALLHRAGYVFNMTKAIHKNAGDAAERHIDPLEAELEKAMRVVEAARKLTAAMSRGRRWIEESEEIDDALRALDAATEGEKASFCQTCGFGASAANHTNGHHVFEPYAIEPAPPQSEGGESAEAPCTKCGFRVGARCSELSATIDALRAQLAEAEKKNAGLDVLKRAHDALADESERRGDEIERLRAKCSRQRRELKRVNAKMRYVNATQGHLECNVMLDEANKLTDMLRAQLAEAEKREPTEQEMLAALGDADEAFLGGTVRRCVDCRKPVFGGPTRCVLCVHRIDISAIAEKTAREQREACAKRAIEWNSWQMVGSTPLVIDAPSKPASARVVGSSRMLGSLGMKAKPSGRDAIAREIASWDQYTCRHCDQPKSAHWNDGNHLMCDNYRNERFMPVDSPATTCKHGAPNCTAEHE